MPAAVFPVLTRPMGGMLVWPIAGRMPAMALVTHLMTLMLRMVVFHRAFLVRD